VIKNQNLQRGLLAGGIVFAVAILFLLGYLLRLRNRRNQALTDLNIALSERTEALSERNSALTERNDALAEMNTTKEKFFSIISHDLKNPALAQRDALQLLVDNADLWNADTIKRYYHRLLNSADEQVELLYHLLNWAQVQTGRMEYTPSPLDLTAYLRSDLSLIRTMAEKKNIAFDVNIPSSAIVTADRNMIATVVRNLLTNAVKFTPAGGTVTFVIADAFRNPPQQYTISITDTGVGMTADQIRDLFHIDRRRSIKGTAGEHGTGIGLVVCKEL